MHFSRPELASQFADDLQGKSFLSDGKNGMFLAAPRRTGKTVFLREDLTPELQNRHLTVVYVDFWADRRRDPSYLLLEAIEQAIAKHAGPVKKAATALGVTRVSIASAVSFDLSKEGATGKTLVTALKQLKELTGQPIALIIDEAQQSLTSKDGEAAMFALKSARDQMNTPSESNLLLIMSGSDRDKLLRLVNNNTAPFLGSVIMPMPALGLPYVAAVAKELEGRHAHLMGVDRDQLHQVFNTFGAQPQLFSSAIRTVLAQENPQNGRDFCEDLKKSADAHRANKFDLMTSEFNGLSVIEQAILVHLLSVGEGFQAYNAKAMASYKDYSGDEHTVIQVQAALEKLRVRETPLIWKSSRGEYASENSAMKEWKESLVATNSWPPARGASVPKRSRRS